MFKKVFLIPSFALASITPVITTSLVNANSSSLKLNNSNYHYYHNLDMSVYNEETGYNSDNVHVEKLPFDINLISSYSDLYNALAQNGYSEYNFLPCSGTFQYDDVAGICANTNTNEIEITTKYSDGAIWFSLDKNSSYVYGDHLGTYQTTYATGHYLSYVFVLKSNVFYADRSDPAIMNFYEISRALRDGGFTDENHQLSVDKSESLYKDQGVVFSPWHYNIRSIYLSDDSHIFCNVVHSNNITLSSDGFETVYSTIV